MDTDLPIPLSTAFLKVTRVRAQVCPKMCAPNLPRSVTPRPLGRWATPAVRPELHLAPEAGSTPAPSPALSLRPAQGPPRSAPLARSLRISASAAGGSRGSRGSTTCLHGDTAASQSRCSEPSTSGERDWVSGSAVRGIALRGSQTGWDSGTPRLPRHRLRRNYLEKKDAIKAPKCRQNGRLLLFEPKEKVMTEPHEVSPKCFFGRRSRMANKHCSSSVQLSPSVTKTFSAKKDTSPRKNEDKVSSKNIENKVSSKSAENKDVLNRQSEMWSSPFITESTGETSKEGVLAKQEKNNEYCPQDVNDKVSESMDDEGEDDTNDEGDEGSNPKRETRAPLELMAEFLRAEMGRDYHLAKKLCEMILIYEPENAVAKEFFSLIEEILLKEKAQNLAEEEEEDSEDSSSEAESEGESSEDVSEDSSDECEDGS